MWSSLRGLGQTDEQNRQSAAFSGLRTTALSALFFNNLTLQSGPSFVTIL